MKDNSKATKKRKKNSKSRSFCFISNPRGNSTFTQSAQEMEGEKNSKVSEMAQQVNALDTEPSDLNSILGTHVMEN